MNKKQIDWIVSPELDGGTCDISDHECGEKKCSFWEDATKVEIIVNGRKYIRLVGYVDETERGSMASEKAIDEACRQEVESLTYGCKDVNATWKIVE